LPEHLKGVPDYLCRILTQLPVKAGIVVRINAALERQGISGSGVGAAKNRTPV
jgi:hypothetical protein